MLHSDVQPHLVDLTPPFTTISGAPCCSLIRLPGSCGSLCGSSWLPSDSCCLFFPPSSLQSHGYCQLLQEASLWIQHLQVAWCCLLLPPQLTVVLVNHCKGETRAFLGCSFLVFPPKSHRQVLTENSTASSWLSETK